MINQFIRNQNDLKQESKNTTEKENTERIYRGSTIIAYVPLRNRAMILLLMQKTKLKHFKRLQGITCISNFSHQDPFIRA